MRSRSVRGLALVSGVLAVAVSMGLASAASGATRGEAQAAFQAFFTGGSAMRFHNPEANGAPGVPVDPPPDSARIYPIEDVVYCQEGWHVVMLGIFDDPAFYPSRQDLFASLLSVSVEFFLDGVPLDMKQTSIREIPHPPPEISENPLMVTNFGSFVAPGELSLGTHQLRTIVLDPVFGDDDWTVSFTVVTC